MKTTVTAYKDTLNEHRLTVKADENGQILFPLEGYKNKSEMISTAVRVSKAILLEFAPDELSNSDNEE